MRKKTSSLLVFLFLFVSVTVLKAAYFEFLPYEIEQPDGTTIHCFVSGDEYFNWIHDKDGYTIIEASDGWYYYAEKDGDLVKPSKYRVNAVNPSDAGLVKWVRIGPGEYWRKKAALESYKVEKGGPEMTPQTGTINNIVVYIRFSDDVEFTTTRQFYDDKFNQTEGVSLKSYYQEVSYGKLTINSTHYPASAMTTNISFQDSHARNYYQPYNATTNPSGYSTDTEKTGREQTLLATAINWLNSGSQFPSSLNADGDNDGNVDNVCFIIKGSNGAWDDLLWAHRTALYTKTVYINGKRVYGYTLQPETQSTVSTLCHEMFHSIGAPDLYHYTDQGVIYPCGNWDLMDRGSAHMLAYMKWKYSKNSWISTIPVIEATGTYTLNPLTSSSNNCYKIISPYSLNEYFIVEYRSKTGLFESNLPGSGLIVYRIDTRVMGNSDGPPDEVYVYRPGGTTSVNGNPSSANFSSTVGRTAINDVTDPKSFLQNGSVGGLNISNVTAAGSTISFKFTATLPEPPGIPGSPAAIIIQQTNFTAKWNSAPNSLGYKLDVSTSAAFTSFVPGYNNKDAGNVNELLISGLSAKTQYYFRVKGYNSAGNGQVSETVAVRTFSNPSTVPANLSAISCNDQITLKWKKSSGADFKQYQIYTKTSAGTLVLADSATGGISDTSRIFYGFTRGTIHYFRVTAINIDEVKSNYSNEASASVKTGVIPRVGSKWGDVLICYNIGDSIKNFQWYINESPIAGATSQYYKTNKLAGLYNVQVIDLEGCKNISSSIRPQSSVSGSVSIYPNPASTNISLKITDDRDGIVRIMILSQLGTKVYEYITDKGDVELVKEIAVAGWAPGMYNVQITIDNEGYYTGSVIILR